MNGHTLMLAGLALTGLGLASMAFPRVRRVFRAVCTFTLAHIPRWLAFILAPVLAACQLIPGWFDELGVLGLVLGPVLMRAANRRELAASVKAAWRN